MAQKVSKKSNSVESAPKQPTATEMRNWYMENHKHIEAYASAEQAAKLLRDVAKTSTKTITAFNKETLRSYLQNIGSNEKNLRSLSRYLYYRSQVYYRLIMYNANMFCLDARSVIPSFDLVKGGDVNKTLKSYQNTLSVLDKMNLQYELLKAYVTCFREDVFYGCVYYDDTGMFILPLDPDYCKITGVYASGDFSFHMDMSYFRQRQTILEAWGEPFQSMYGAYEADTTGGKWQPMPDEYAICLKARAEDWETVVPVFSGMFNSLINLLDLEDIQAIADEQEIYKMIWLELETLQGSNEPDDWKVDPSLVIQYFNKMVSEAMPDYTSAAVVPGKLATIDFNSDAAKETNKVAKSTETVLNSAGGAQILNSSTISGTTAFTASVKSDTEFAISMLLPQTQAWVNRFLSYQVTNPAKVKFFEVSVYTKEELKKNLLESATYGLPTKLALNALNGFSELETMAMNFLEEECLQITDKFVPLQSSHTMSNNSDSEGGAPVKDVTDGLTDAGEASREKTDNKN